MFRHNILLAVRNLKKYWIQTLISILCLVLGFVCSAFSTIWTRYEISFDSFHRGAEHLYLLYDDMALLENDYYSSYGTRSYDFNVIFNLHKYISEVEDATVFGNNPFLIKKSVEEEPDHYNVLVCDQSFIRMFDIKLVSGTWDFLKNDSEIALTEKGARKIFGTTDVLGKELYLYDKKHRITAIVSDWKQNSRILFDCVHMFSYPVKNLSVNSYYKTCVRLFPEANVDSVEAKIFRLKSDSSLCANEKIRLEPLMAGYNSILRSDGAISAYYIRLLAILGVTLIVLALISFFSIQIIRMRMRRREISLRITCGAGLGSLVSLFVTELVILLLFTLLGSMVLTELLQKRFCIMTGMEEDILWPAFCYFCSLAMISILIGWGVIYVYCRQIVRKLMTPVHRHYFKSFTFHQLCIVCQLTICTLVLFGLSVLLGQLDYLLYKKDYGFNRNGLACIHIFLPNNGPKAVNLKKTVLHELSAKPYVREARMLASLLPYYSQVKRKIDSWSGKKDDDRPKMIKYCVEKTDFYQFYGIRLASGRFLTQSPDSKEIMINEAAARVLGMKEPIGKKIDEYTIVGVIKDYHTLSPTLPSPPIMYLPYDGFSHESLSIMVRLDENRKKELKECLDSIILSKKVQQYVQVDFIDDIYNSYLKSENLLLKVLSAMALVSVLIMLMGVYVHITMACEYRKKEIAIRKVNGATAWNVMYSFINEYLLLLCIACLLAFPLGTWGVQLWLDRYVDHISLSWWLYLGIFILLLMFILLCIIRKVWGVAHENPSEVIKCD